MEVSTVPVEAQRSVAQQLLDPRPSPSPSSRAALPEQQSARSLRSTICKGLDRRSELEEEDETTLRSHTRVPHPHSSLRILRTFTVTVQSNGSCRFSNL